MLTAKTILVVEDERPLASVIKRKLEQYKYKVSLAESVKIALEKLDSEKNIVAIWLDHYLIGKESGLDFLVHLKSEGGKWQKTLVFLVTNTASNDKIKAYLELGVDKYFVKAANRLEEIADEIRKRIER